MPEFRVDRPIQRNYEADIARLQAQIDDLRKAINQKSASSTTVGTTVAATSTVSVDHHRLSNLSDGDDHPQYLTRGRGDGLYGKVGQGNISSIGASTNITAVPGSFADLAAVQSYLAGSGVVPNIESRLDALETKVNALLTALAGAGIITNT